MLTYMYVHTHMLTGTHTRGQALKKKAYLLLIGCLLDSTSDNLLYTGSVACCLYILGASLEAEEHMIWHVSSSLGGT